MSLSALAAARLVVRPSASLFSRWASTASAITSIDPPKRRPGRPKVDPNAEVKPKPPKSSAPPKPRKRRTNAELDLLDPERTAKKQDPPRPDVTEFERFYPLPPIDTWREHFSGMHKGVRERVSISNSQSAVDVAHSFIEGPSTRTDQPKVVIEAFPGALLSFVERVGVRLIASVASRSWRAVQSTPNATAFEAPQVDYPGGSQAVPGLPICLSVSSVSRSYTNLVP